MRPYRTPGARENPVAAERALLAAQEHRLHIQQRVRVHIHQESPG